MCDPTNDPERRNRSLDDITEKEYADSYRLQMKQWSDKVVEPSLDAVNHPRHYTGRKMEAIDIIEMIIETEPNPKVAYAMSNVLKYILRFRDKGKPVEDMKKSSWYLNRMIKHLEDETNA